MRGSLHLKTIYDMSEEIHFRNLYCIILADLLLGPKAREAITGDYSYCQRILVSSIEGKGEEGR